MSALTLHWPARRLGLFLMVLLLLSTQNVQAATIYLKAKDSLFMAPF
ncbi:MAG: hypothetical protein U0894_03870 [Pirellulales bacterium]